MGEMVAPGLWQGKYKVSPEHPTSESKEVSDGSGNVKSSSYLPNLEQKYLMVGMDNKS